MTQFDTDETTAYEDDVQFVPAEEADVEAEDLDVDTTSDEDDEVEDVPATDEAKEEKPKKEKAQPKRGDLPEGYTTPVGLAKIITERELYRTRDGEVAELKPQMVYSYAKNAPKDNPFPAEEIEDSLGNKRNVVQIEAGVDWWVRKNERAEERRANAAKKASDKKAREEKKAAEVVDEAEGDDEQGVAEEAE